MSDQKRLARRFYKVATVEPRGDAYRIVLDGRPVRTPAKRELAVASESLAQSLAAEWQGQGETIDPSTMPLTRLVNSALDGVVGREAEVRADIVEYAGSDLICYFATAPDELIERQTRQWGAVHAWAEAALGVRLVLTEGIMPVAQDQVMLARIDAALGGDDALSLAALHVVTTLTGSVLLALAVARGQLRPAEAWALAHIDEDFQIEQWGEDEEAAARRAKRWLEMQAACRMLGRA